MNKLFLILIVLLAFIVRFYQLDTYPAFNADEAALGYNAYSLLETGKDEHGNPWPIHFQSFNDYKPGLYVYLIAPFVAMLGLSEWSVRIPGALLGGVTILVVYYLVAELSLRGGMTKQSLKNKESLIRDRHASARDDVQDNILPLLVALFITISPWHIHFSRGAWEVNVATFFITLGLWLFLKFINTTVIPAKAGIYKDRAYLYGFRIKSGMTKNFYLLFSLSSFVLSLYTYHAARIIVPLLGIGLLFLYWKDLWTKKAYLIGASILGFVLLIPLLIDLAGPAGLSRAAGVGLFADPGPLNRVNQLRGHHSDYQSESAVVMHNKLVNYGIEFVKNWTEHYEGEFLFLSGDIIERNRVPETGQTHMIFIIFFGIGIYAITKQFSQVSEGLPSETMNYELKTKNSQKEENGDLQKRTKGWKLILWWFAIAPLGAALTFQSPHALRAQNMVIPFEIINALGLYTLVNFVRSSVKSKFLLFIVYCLLFILILWSFARYQHMYWVHMAKEYPYSSQYGVKELVDYVLSKDVEYEKVLVTDRYDQPYILLLFYGAAKGDPNFHPAKFQREHVLSPRDQFGFSTVRSFGKYHFWPIDFNAAKRDYPNSLIAGTDEQIPKEANIVKKIYGTNEFLYFEVVAN